MIEKSSLISAAHLIVFGELPDEKTEKFMTDHAVKAAKNRVPEVCRNQNEDVSKTFEKYLLTDEELTTFRPDGKLNQVEKTGFCLGRFAAYIAHILEHESVLGEADPEAPFAELLYRVITGENEINPAKSRMLEAMIIASIDHGVTPTSTQATIIAFSVRASYEVAVAHGVGAITDVHGGAGEKAAAFFRQCAELADKKNLSPRDATRTIISEYIKNGRRIEGMGHRINTQDPRRDVLWNLAEATGMTGSWVAISKIASDILQEVRGMILPINVDGVIGAIIADMGLDPKLANALFIFGRVAGLSAHHFEEITSQSPMCRINFSEAVYKGVDERPFL